MTDLKTLILVIEQRISIAERNNQAFVDLPYDTVGDAFAMLKEQQQQIWELQDQVEYLTDKQKEQETTNLYKCPNCGTWVSAENVVRCKDCKYIEESTAPFHDYWCQRLEKFCDGDWFCADGEKKVKLE